MRKYRTEIRFNGRTSGGGQVLADVVEALSPQNAINALTARAVRLPDHGHSIYVTGATVDEVKE